MLSRVAESIYWLNRYVERAENVARFIDVNVNLMIGAPSEFANQWQPLISTTGDDKEFARRYGDDFSRPNVVGFLLYDKENPNSIYSCVCRARENARAVRQVVPEVVWEQLNQFYHLTRNAAMKADTGDNVQDFCEKVRLSSHLLTGAADASMSAGEAWHFARLGRMIERADKTSRIVDVQYFLLLPKSNEVGSTLDVVRWSALLRSTNALAMYRRAFGTITPNQVAEFLILDRFFPRSMHHCVLTAQESLLSITGQRPGTFANAAERRLGRLCASLDYASIDDIISSGLHEYIDGFQVQLNEIGKAISDHFFTSHGPAAQSQYQSM